MCHKFAPGVFQFKADETIHHDHQEEGEGVLGQKIDAEDFCPPTPRLGVPYGRGAKNSLIL